MPETTGPIDESPPLAEIAKEVAVIELNEKGLRRPATPSPNFRLNHDRWQTVFRDAGGFENKLRLLRNNDKGRMANLRRNNGRTLAEARGVAWIEEWLSSEGRRRFDEQYFLAATLFDLNRETARNEDFGAAMRRVSAEASESFQRRFTVLLDSTFDILDSNEGGSPVGGGELAYRLTQMVKQAASKKIGIDWTLLLTDLCCWDLPGKPIQKKWARNFFAPGLQSDQDRLAAAGEE